MSGLCRSILATDSTVNDTITAALPGIFTLLGGLAGALIAWRIGRARETRNLREDVYIGWLKAARFLGSWPSNQPTPTGGNIQVPHPAMKERDQRGDYRTRAGRVQGSRRRSEPVSRGDQVAWPGGRDEPTRLEDIR